MKTLIVYTKEKMMQERESLNKAIQIQDEMVIALNKLDLGDAACCHVSTIVCGGDWISIELTPYKVSKEEERIILKEGRHVTKVGRVTREFSSTRGSFSWIGEGERDGGIIALRIALSTPANCKLTKKTKTQTYYEADCTTDRKQAKLFNGG